MSLFAVLREAGPGWSEGGIVDQSGVDEHSAFMNGLAEERFVLFAGPLAGTEAGRLRALLIVDAMDEAEVDARLADDPWAASGHLGLVSVEPWHILVGAERLEPQPYSAHGAASA
jgi:uncharacterized protein YciI